MNDKTLYITRHGETQWNTVRRMQGQQDSPLTEMGLQQAQWLGERLKSEKVDVIYSSPLGRAKQTSQIIGECCQIPVIYEDALKEIYLGSWEGQLIQTVSQNYTEKSHHFWTQPELYIPVDGELFEEVVDRVGRFYEQVVKACDESKILIVGHAIVLKCLFMYIQKSDLKDLWNGPVIKPTSLTKGYLTDGALSIEFMSDTSHYKKDSNNNGWFIDEKK